MLRTQARLKLDGAGHARLPVGGHGGRRPRECCHFDLPVVACRDQSPHALVVVELRDPVGVEPELHDERCREVLVCAQRRLDRRLVAAPLR
eukprot:3899882-Prymnesium_polylepis.1